MVYLWNGRAYASETRRALELNVGRGGMKRLMGEAATRYVKTVHYSASVGIWVGSDEVRKTKDSRFWQKMLEGLAGVQLRKKKRTASKDGSGR